MKTNNRGHNASDHGFISVRIPVGSPNPSNLLLDGDVTAGSGDGDESGVTSFQDTLFTMQQVIQEKAEEKVTPPKWMYTSKKGKSAVRKKDLRIAIMESDTPLVAEVLEEMEPYDLAQRNNLVMSEIGRVIWRLEQEDIDPFALVDKDEWREWCRGEADRLKDSHPLRALEYEQMGEQMHPTEVEAGVLRDLRLQMIESKESLDREIRYLAAYRDISYEDAMEAFTSTRDAFYAEGEYQPQTPGWYDTAIGHSYSYERKRTKPPLDGGTEYALYAVLTDASLTAQYPRLQRGYVVFDTETTSAEADASVVQLTAIAYDYEGRETGRINTYVNPGNDSSGNPIESIPEAANVHHITLETTRNAPTFAELAPQVQTLMSGSGSTPPVLIAHNLQFDFSKVDRDLRAAGEEGLGRNVVADTLFLARCAQPNPGVPNAEHRHNLESACKREGIEFNPEDAHDSSYDVSRTALLFTALRRRFG